MPTKQQAINVPIDKGTKPDWDTRLGYPQLLNMYVGDSRYLYTTPGLALIASLRDVRQVKYTLFDNSYIVVTNTIIYRVFQNGNFNIVANIVFSGLPVQMDENLQNQITIVDGSKAYVIDQPNSLFVELGEDEGFTLETPCSVVVLNTFTIVLDKSTGTWVISSPNNALNYPPLDFVPQIESQLTEAMSLGTLGNNLFIFGSTGIERWEPNYNTNIYLFPLSRDNNFRKDFGAISTSGVVRGNDIIYFLSSRYIPMALSQGNIQEIGDTGMARVISQYPDVSECISSFYSFRGNYYFHMTFPDTAISWVFNQNSQTWGLSDDLVVGAPPNREVVATPTGLYNLSLIPSYKKRMLITERIFGYKGQQTYRNTLNGCELKIVQGRYQRVDSTHPSPQHAYLSISVDSDNWKNRVTQPIGKTGKREATTLWRTNITGYEFTPRFEYYGDLELTIEKVTMYIK